MKLATLPFFDANIEELKYPISKMSIFSSVPTLIPISQMVMIRFK
jgi:hypothetical protein